MMPPPKKKKVLEPIPVTVEQEPDMPVATTDTTLGSPHGFNWNVAMKLLQPIILALIGLATVYYGNRASNAAVDARVTAAQTQVKVDSTASVRDTQIGRLQQTTDSTHSLVNSQKVALQRELRAARAEIRRLGGRLGPVTPGSTSVDSTAPSKETP